MKAAAKALGEALLVATIVAGCASSTVIRSNPPGATVRSNTGAVLGKTPYVHSDTRTVDHHERFTVELDGYETAKLVIRRDQWDTTRTVAFGIGGFFFTPLFVGLLWAQNYPPEHDVELQPQGTFGTPGPQPHGSPAAPTALPPPTPPPL